MSINHFSSDLPESHWWAQQQQQPPPSTKSSSSRYNNTRPHFWDNSRLYHPVSMTCNQNSTLNLDLNEDDGETEEQLSEEREYSVKEEAEGHFREQEIPKKSLFEKPLTPSDVGKLNRLVIPKQHAEKYFPLNGISDSGEKGLLLSFEDERGKPWRFRYSYWNSSQSYVLTKGWSRFVKEKRLDAGDVVLFERHRLDVDRFFIGWRRRSAAATPGPVDSGRVAQPVTAVASGSGGGGWPRLLFSGHPYPPQPPPHGPPLPYQPHCLHAASVLQSQTTPNANSKRLRLFGVNLECHPDESEPPTPDVSSSTSNQEHSHAYHNHRYQFYPKVQEYNHQNHMDINFSRDVNQTRYRQG